MARFWLGPWVWNSPPGGDTYWSAPSGAVSSVDLRSLPACSVAGGSPQGVGLFVTANATNLGSSYTNLGTDPTVVLSGSQKSALQTLLSLPNALQSNTLQNAIYEAMTLQSDPTGLDRMCPLVPTVNPCRYELWLAGQLARSANFDIGGVEAAPLRDLLQREYRAIRQACLDGSLPPIHYRKVLGYWVRKYLVGYRWFEPLDLPDEPDLPPSTTISDNFNRADGALGSSSEGWSWTNVTGTITIVSNQAKWNATNHAAARAESDLSSADHYAQVARIDSVNGSGVAYSSCCARFNASATTYYTGLWRTGAGQAGLFKRVAGTLTQLTTDLTLEDAPHTYKVECNGSTINGYRDGVLDGTVSDSSISGNLRTGITVRESGNIVDNFTAADLAVASRLLLRRRRMAA